ncbi:type II toxin-antitoxin system VapC family toxin [Leptolyngbya sp. NIES-2104]|uniref:type II toxin-antitoxin system VapC family toxin n=1 Tax=Leptolyngbya sp. NIES-2104 TaxID=1552121 RepID=UPI0006ECABF3|nr:type II toxin-antitoxin system VapC family toxin [Leptolyngbya sp. NIES-2104]GAP96228.1 hypothetical protein NIES2104_27630 [Leptolyngbya sp. NIES-2104]
MNLVADTHTIIWYLTRPQELSETALSVLDGASDLGDLIYLSAISLVEICYLVERDRIPASILERLQVELSAEDAGIKIAALDQLIAFAIQQIDRSTVPEMPDRIIAATAYHLSLPLVTRDHRIRQLQTIQTIW